MKHSTREHFSLLLEKFTAKCKNEEKLSGVEVEDSELDTAMEEIWGKRQEAEVQDMACNNANKEKIEADRASRDHLRKKACKKLVETSKRKQEEEGAEKKSKSREGMEMIPLNFCRRKQNKIMKRNKKNNNTKKESMSDKFNYKSNFYLHNSNSSNRCKC